MRLSVGKERTRLPNVTLRYYFSISTETTDSSTSDSSEGNTTKTTDSSTSDSSEGNTTTSDGNTTTTSNTSSASDSTTPVDGEWGPWLEWTDCNQTCGEETQTFVRSCDSPAPANGGDDCVGNDVKTEPCNHDPCPVDGGWGNWAELTGCDETCGQGTVTYTRSCDNPVPANGGDDCFGSNNKTESCNLGPCPVHGNWGHWADFTGCDQTCGEGTVTYTRSCDNPVPANGGDDCFGSDTKTESCNNGPCPVHGNWGHWADFTGCDQTCGEGTVTYTRSCDNPVPANGGDDCFGSDTKTESCNNGPCPVHGNWGHWADFTGCDQTCGEGTVTYTRSCDNPVPANGGDDCFGSDTKTESCNNGPCPVHGNWGHWADFTGCDQTCGEGTVTYTRSCDNPVPANGGDDCFGSDTKTESCNNGPCPVHGNWGHWADFTGCDQTCGEGTVTYTRSCDNPVPANGGDDCFGSDTKTESCNNGPCPVHGNWGHWADFTGCDQTCGEGTVTYTRSCDNPVPANGGDDCFGSDTKTESCNNGPCPDEYSVCQCKGDPHCNSFDGTRFHYQGTCEYLLARDDCDGSGDWNFQIYADFWTRNRVDSRVSWVKSVKTRLNIGGTVTEIVFGQRKQVSVNGVVVTTFPYPSTMVSGYRIVKTWRYVILQTQMDLKVKWDGYKTVQIKVRDLPYFDDTCGLCGILSNDKDDDFTLGSSCGSIEGQITTDHNEFGDSHEVSGDDACCGTVDPPPCDNPAAVTTCDEVFDTQGAVFGECLRSWTASKLDFEIEACVEDICLGGDLTCDIITRLIDDCLTLGFTIVNWGNWNNCQPDCGVNMSFLSCEPGRALTCNEYLNQETNVVTECIADCYCDEHYYYDENTGTCVLPEDCGCQRTTNGIPLAYQDGAVIITQECGTYIQCENNNFVEYTSNCDANATCEVTNDVFSCECPINMADINGDGSECRENIIICEHDTYTISCPPGELINITYMNYGRTEFDPCPHTKRADLQCYSDQAATDAVISSCDGYIDAP
ncbi:hypothetical protein ScPMuIL_011998 [Solemya velum]